MSDAKLDIHDVVPEDAIDASINAHLSRDLDAADLAEAKGGPSAFLGNINRLHLFTRPMGFLFKTIPWVALVLMPISAWVFGSDGMFWRNVAIVTFILAFLQMLARRTYLHQLRKGLEHFQELRWGVADKKERKEQMATADLFAKAWMRRPLPHTTDMWTVFEHGFEVIKEDVARNEAEHAADLAELREYIEDRGGEWIDYSKQH